jgi:hypothetical protein
MKSTPTQLVALGGLIANNQVAIALGSKAEAIQARAVIAGILAAAHVLLSAAQFRALIVQCEIDLCQLADMFDLARGKPSEPDPGQTEVEHFLEFVAGVTNEPAKEKAIDV